MPTRLAGEHGADDGAAVALPQPRDVSDGHVVSGLTRHRLRLRVQPAVLGEWLPGGAPLVDFKNLFKSLLNFKDPLQIPVEC